VDLTTAELPEPTPSKDNPALAAFTEMASMAEAVTQAAADSSQEEFKHETRSDEFD
jgi:hypothetical protein